MADGNFRAYRRDPVAPHSGEAAPRAEYDDPLAELARLIGQSEPMQEGGRGAGRGGFDQPSGGVDWAASGRYAESEEPAETGDDPQYDERYAPARQGESTEVPDQFSAPEPRLTAVRESTRVYATELTRYREQEPPESYARDLPAFLPHGRDQRYQFDDRMQAPSHDHAYELEDEDEEAPGARRRGGLVVVAAVLGLAVIGTAGAFAYRAMFGASMLPSLPPIIKADDGPNKIVPSNPRSGATTQADANRAGSGEKLVSREEQPVDMPTPANPAPRVVSTIPIFPDPNAARAGMIGSGTASNPAPAAPAAIAPAAPAPPQPAPSAVAMPRTSATPALPAAAAPMAPPAVSPEPKKIHTVTIRADQMGGTEEAAPPSSPPPPQPAPAPAPVRAAPPRAAAAPAPKPVPAPQAESNAPLSIIPQQGGALPAPPPAPARARAASAQPMPLNATPEKPSAPPPVTAPTAGGSYAVQVTSQRSEAEAQTEFRTLRARFPNQLGGREPIVRRADLGAKGVFYRALVGPFASMEQAAQMCSSLKAAGGTCVVQHD